MLLLLVKLGLKSDQVKFKPSKILNKQNKTNLKDLECWDIFVIIDMKTFSIKN